MDLFQQLLIPSLISCRADVKRNRLTDEDQAWIFRTVRQILERLDSYSAPEDKQDSGVREALAQETPADKPTIIGWPANDEGDELALLMLAEILQPARCEMRVLSSQKPFSEAMNEIEHRHPALVCVGSLAAGSQLGARQFCQHFRSRHPDLRIIVGCWGTKDREKAQQQLSSTVDALTWTLPETASQVVRLSQEIAFGGSAARKSLSGGACGPVSFDAPKVSIFD
jgi:hypothetical protein